MLITCLKCNRQLDTGTASPGDTVKCSCGLSILVPEGPVEAGKMNCPACGAPVDPAEKKCIFCGTPLGTVICPGCFGGVFQGSKHCPHCGEALEGRVVIHGNETARLCPRCHEALRVEVAAGKPLERCAKCEGMWVDRETVEKIYKSREQTTAIQKVMAPAKPTTQKIPMVGDGYLKCPVCSQLMYRQNFGRFSGVLIDVCRQHGTWFDADELHHILDFIGSGGLEKAAKREKEALEAEIQSLRNRQSTGGGVGMGLGSGLMADVGRNTVGHSAIAIAGAVLKKLFWD